MKAEQVHFGIGLGVLALTSILTATWVVMAGNRLEQYVAAQQAGTAPSGPLASASDSGYCTGELKPILRRVLTSCGLMGGGARGCRPLEAQSVAAMAGGDFNALFLPLSERAAILEFGKDDAALDAPAISLLEKTFADQRGASYFFVVSRASPEGSVSHNQELSRLRAQAVLDHLRSRFEDPDLDQEVGLLWLGEEFAQLNEEFCTWNRSHPEVPCSAEDLNRSAFIAWIDCRL